MIEVALRHRRRARAGFGAILIAGAVGMPLYVMQRQLLRTVFGADLYRYRGVIALVVIWVVAGAALWLLSPVKPAAQHRGPDDTGATESASPSGPRSFWIPSIGIALFGTLTVHFIIRGFIPSSNTAFMLIYVAGALGVIGFPLLLAQRSSSLARAPSDVSIGRSTLFVTLATATLAGLPTFLFVVARQAMTSVGVAGWGMFVLTTAMLAMPAALLTPPTLLWVRRQVAREAAMQREH